MPFDARQIANYFITKSLDVGVPLDHVKLQKLIYFGHGWHLAEFDSALIRNRIEAWEYGPVVKVVYDEFSKFGSSAITSFAKQLNLETGQYEIAAPALSPAVATLLSNVFSFYAKIQPFDLSRLTHVAGGPWDQVWNKPRGGITLGMWISNASIKSFFDSHKKNPAITIN